MAENYSITVSFSENAKGWVSFKSFLPEIAFSLNNNYYTANTGILWIHHDEKVDRNSLYRPDGTKNANINSSVTVLFNDNPSSVKSFTTLNYEGSQAKVIQNLNDEKHYNNEARDGWYANSIITDQQTGTVEEFINKEGKWFNHIIGEETHWTNGVSFQRQAPISGAEGNLDTKEFSTQGIGMITEITLIDNDGNPHTVTPIAIFP